MNILFLGAHTDDIELGAGGVMLALSKSHNIQYLSFSRCTDLDRNKNIRDDQKDVVDFLTEKKISVTMYDFTNKCLHKADSKIREILEEHREKTDIVFTHWLGDAHQDHRAVGEETLRILKGKTIFQYECLSSCSGFFANTYYPLTVDDVNLKWNLLSLYKTQLSTGYVSQESNFAHAKYNGVKSGYEFAEGFFAHRVNLGDLICVQ